MQARALSIRQPWANMLLDGTKTIEIRSQNTNYRGTLFLHASKTVDYEAKQLHTISVEPQGCIIGCGQLIDVKQYLDFETFIQDQAKHKNPYERWDGPCFGWIFQNVKPVNTIPLCGQLGIFRVELPDSIALESPDIAEKNIYSYCRVSSKEQEEKQTIENQIRNIEDYARRNKLKIARWFKDEATTGKTNARKQFQELIRNIGDCDILIVDAMDRLSRDTVIALQIRSMLIDNGVQLISLKEPEMEYESADGKFIYTLRAALAERESNRHSERIKDGINGYIKEYGRWGRYKQRERLKKSKNRILELYGSQDQPGVSCAALARHYAVSAKLMKSVLKGWGVYRSKK